MKRNLSTRRIGFMALGLAFAVLGATRWLPEPPGRDGAGADHYGLDGAAAQRDDPDLGRATQRPVRRLRASSTMPYFSFAQSLRSRG